MPTYWKYRDEVAGELGPIAFPELVERVREGQIDREAKVFSVDQNRWLFASDVFGLFYMAGRDDAPILGSDASDIGSIDSPIDAETAITESDADVPSWQKRLREMDAIRAHEEAERAEAESAQKIARAFETRKHQAAEAAVERLERKEALRAKAQSFRRRLGEVFSNESIGNAFSYVAAFLAANLAALGILSWAETELQRYPDRRGTAFLPQVFPLWGECTQVEFMLLLFPLMLMVGFVAYLGAKFLVAMVDE